MATLKVAQLRATLDQFADLYDNAAASDQAIILRKLSAALAQADDLPVEQLVRALKNDGKRNQTSSSLKPRH
jgi:hypothetical protein